MATTVEKAEAVELFEKFRTHKDKFESLYMLIVHEIETTELIEKVSHQIKLINTVQDSMKRKYLNDRMFGFKTYLTTQKYNKENEKISKVFFIFEETEEVDLKKEWKQVLSDFQVENYIFKYGGVFDIDYLVDLFTDISFKNVVAVRNNVLQHMHLNSTKKRTICTKDEKSLDVEKYVKENIKEPCVVHGSSVALKNFKSDEHIIIHKHLKDEEVLDEFSNLHNKAVLTELAEVLGYIQNPKMMHRVIFGKDIGKGIKNQTIKTIFCTKDIYDKMQKNIDPSLLNFDIKVVFVKDEGDVADVIKTQYNGAIGFTYY